jgi:hypothetical protein
VERILEIFRNAGSAIAVNTHIAIRTRKIKNVEFFKSFFILCDPFSTTIAGYQETAIFMMET